jgi:hypothetical protein
VPWIPDDFSKPKFRYWFGSKPVFSVLSNHAHNFILWTYFESVFKSGVVFRFTQKAVLKVSVFFRILGRLAQKLDRLWKTISLIFDVFYYQIFVENSKPKRNWKKQKL